jgi:predicted nuclease of predicted toxin-antitoxin system
MKILLDECLPLDFRHHLPGHEVHTAEWAGFKSLKNGELLQQAEDAGYDVFLTIDQGIPHQQNLTQRRISILVIRARTNQIEDLLPLLGVILSKLKEIQPGQIVSTS